MTKISQYPVLASALADDTLLGNDVHDTSAGSSGTTKQVRVGGLPFLPCQLATAAIFSSLNPVLATGLLGVETDTGLAKMGNGTTRWNALRYWNPAGTGGGGTTRVASVTQTISVQHTANPVLSQPQDRTISAAPVIDVIPSASVQATGTSPSPSPVTEVTGSTVTSNSFQVTSFEVSPAAVGNLLILAMNAGSSAFADTTVSGGGVTTWTRATALEYDSSGSPQLDVEIWTGVVTAAGTATLTVTNPGMTGWPKFFVREFTSAGQGLQWSVLAAAPSAATAQGTPSHTGSPVSLPSTLGAGSYLGAVAAEWGTVNGVPVTGVSYNVGAAGLGIAEYLNGPANVAPSFTDTNTGDNCNVCAIIFQAATQHASLEIVIPAIPEGTATENYALTFTGKGGTGTGYQFAVNSGSLPSGLSMSIGGVISGTIASPGSSTFSVILRDSAGSSTVSKDVTINVVALPPVIFTRNFPADPNYNDDLRSTVDIPRIHIDGAGTNSSANCAMNMWGPVSGEQAVFNVFSIQEWDFLCRVANPGGSVTCFPNSSSWLINIPDWHDFDYFVSGYDEVMDGTPDAPDGIIASACYDNWFTNDLVGPTGFAVNEIMCHFDFRSRGAGPYAATVVPFGGYTVDTPSGPVDIPLTYFDIAYTATTLYFNQVDASGNYKSTPTGTLDWKAMFEWCVTHGYLDPAAPMWAFSVGFEVCHTSGVQRKFRYNDLWWLAGKN